MAPKKKWNLSTATTWIQEQGFDYVALSKIEHTKKVIFVFRCQTGTEDIYDLADIRRQISNDIVPCKCCRRKKKLEEVMESFKSKNLTPIDLNRDYAKRTSYIECIDSDGFVVYAQDLNTRGVRYSPFIFSNPKSIKNVRKLAIDIGFKELVSMEYVDYDTGYVVEDSDGLLYHVYIGSMLRIKREGKDYKEFQKYITHSPFLEHNIQQTALLYGYSPIPGTFKAEKKSIDAINPDGYRVEFNPYQMTGALPKPPNPFDSRCKYYFENVQQLISKVGLNLKVDKKRNIVVTEEGYWCPIRVQELKYRKKPNPFDLSNPYSMKNIHRFCRNKRPGYRPLKGQKYGGAKAKYKFIYRGKDLKAGVNPVFSCDWSNFSSEQGRGHPHRLREVCRNGISKSFNVLRQVIYNSEWRKRSLEQTKGCCLLSGESTEIEVHHLERSYIEILEDAIKKVGLEANLVNGFTEEEKKIIIDEFVILHASEPLGIPLNRSIHRCYHSWVEKNGLPVNKSSFKKFKKVWKIEFDQWRALRDNDNLYVCS